MSTKTVVRLTQRFRQVFESNLQMSRFLSSSLGNGTMLSNLSSENLETNPHIIWLFGFRVNNISHMTVEDFRVSCILSLSPSRYP